MKKTFNAEQFTPTQYATAEEKARWANTMVSWIERGFPASGWTKTLYHRLSNMYMHIAHYNQSGFYSVWFIDDDAKARWLEYIQESRIYGETNYTWSDVEYALQAWIAERNLTSIYIQRAAQVQEKVERALLARLQAKYNQ